MSNFFNFNWKDIWDNKEPVLNLEKADECPHYAVIGWIDKLGPINEYEVYASDDVESLRAKSFDKTSIVDWIEYGSGSNRNEALQYAKEETTKKLSDDERHFLYPRYQKRFTFLVWNCLNKHSTNWTKVTH